MSESPSSKAEYKKTGVANKARDVLSSIRLAIRLLKSDSVTPFLELDSDECVKLANHYISQGIGGKAMHLLTEAILKDPDNVEARWGYALFNEKKYPQIAIDMCDEILKRDPYHMGAIELKMELKSVLDI